MKEITILSGKGGTGKTSITAALASVVKNAVFCDNDVDAANLHLILRPTILEMHQFEGAYVASIQQEKCIQCGLCIDTCRFNAVHETNGQISINPFQCEGCRLCERVCPVRAIISKRSELNHWYISSTRFGMMVHAHMAPGEENSGKLVSLIREKAKKIATEHQLKYILNDGPPGIGCTAISSITGAQQVLLVVEPSKSGIHDAMRVIELANKFRIPVSAIINKFDLNPEMSIEAEQLLHEKSVPVLAKIPFDQSIIEAMIEGKSIVEFHPDSEISKTMQNIWKHLVQDSTSI